MENRAERLLVILLRCIAVVEALAIVPVFMPQSWMDAYNNWLGLGALPEAPIVEYLTRSLSALYAFHAVLLWIVSRDVRRYAALVTYLGVAFLCFGAISLGIDIHAGLPPYWIAAEGPLTSAMGLAMLVLQRRGSAGGGLARE